MDFKTVDRLAEKIIYKGQWKPIFKIRLGGDYFDTSDRTAYEEDLRKKNF